MPEIKCPNCGEIFQVDESGYAEIVAQVRTAEFNREITEKRNSFDIEKEQAVKLARLEEKSKAKESISRKDEEIVTLKTRLEHTKTEEAVKAKDELAKKDNEILALKHQLESFKSQLELAVKNAV